MDAAQLLNGMFVYDKCCLELMLLSSKEVAESLRIHYQGNKKESYSPKIFWNKAMSLYLPLL